MLSPEGALQRTGTYERTISSFAGASIPIPHLQRVSPDHRWLAAFDPTHQVLTLQAVAPPARTLPIVALPTLDSLVANRRIEVTVTDLPGDVQTFRWLDSGAGLVFQHNWRLYVVEPNMRRNRSQTSARPVFADGTVADDLLRHVADFRMLPHGFIARTPQRVYYVHMRDTSPLTTPTVLDLTPEGYTVTAANVMSRGRVVMAVHNSDTSTNEIRVLAPLSNASAVPQVAAQFACEDCTIMNWAPGAERITYATQLENVITERSIDDDSARVSSLGLAPLARPERHGYGIHSLWVSPKDQSILAVDNRVATLWAQDGALLWSWRPTTEEPDAAVLDLLPVVPVGLSESGGDRQRITSAHFTEDGEGVLFTTETEIVLVHAGERIRYILSEGDEIGVQGLGQSGTYLEHALPLKNGATAFAVVRVQPSTAADTSAVNADDLSLGDLLGN